jgi:hypothetical protein
MAKSTPEKARITRRSRIPASRAENPFEKHRGIGNPGIPSGRKAVIRILRQLCGR